MALVKAFRTHGHLAAHLDPLGSEPIGDPALDPVPLGLTPEVMAQIPAGGAPRRGAGRDPAEAFPHSAGDLLRHARVRGRAHRESRGARLAPREDRVGRVHAALPAERRKRLLERLTEVEALERFLHKAYLGQKRFSIEGVDMLVPMLDPHHRDGRR